MNPVSPALDVRDLTVQTGNNLILDRVSLTVEPGRFVAVTGRTGAGKTTLLSAVGGLRLGEAVGSVQVAGHQLIGASADELALVRRRHVGFVFQDLNLVPTLTAAENVALPLQLDGERTSAALEAAAQSLVEVSLGDHVDAYPDELSGGQRQRVAIARALTGSRSLLLADEPTSALDALTAEATLNLLKAKAEAGAAVLMVTHDSSLTGWADSAIRLHDGRRLGGADTDADRLEATSAGSEAMDR